MTLASSQVYHGARNAQFDPANPYRLTDREKEITGLILSGLTSAEAGELLGISRRTVEMHRARVLKKFGARNGTHLAHLISTLQPEFSATSQRIYIEDLSGAVG